MHALNYIPPELLARSRVLAELGIEDRAWPMELVLAVLHVLGGTGVAVLGGDVYDSTTGSAVPTYDSWHSDRGEWETFRHYADRSVEEAREYIRRYAVTGGRQLWVGLVLATEAGES